MTDITELAQSLKAAANTTADAIDRLKAFPGDELIDLSQHEGEQVDIDITTLNEWYELSSPANILALVEALEKALKSNEFLKGQLSELANFNPDWDKLEASYESWREIAAELLVAKERIAELESRTVKLPDFRHEHFNSDWGEHDAEAYQVALREALIAAGIKVEAEFKVRSDDRMMYPPTYCHKHPETVLQVHPFEQLMSHPPQPKMYCPECEPSVAEWAERDKQFRQGRR